MGFRTTIPDFQLANPLYVGASVFFYAIDENGARTSTLATLYAAPIGTVTVANPQILDGDGKFNRPVYLERPVIAEVVGPVVGTHETGIIAADIIGEWQGDWTTATIYDVNDFVRDPATGDIYVTTQNQTSGATIAADLAAGKLVLVVDFAAITQAKADAEAAAALSVTKAGEALASADAAAISETNAGTSETNADLALAEFRTRYLGAAAADPTLDLNGDPVTAGALYFNTAASKMKIYDGASWAFFDSLASLSDVDLTTTPPVTGDGFVFNGTEWVPGPAGGGMFKGNAGTVGSRVGDIFRVNAQELTEDVTIAATENASCAGPLAVATGKTLTIASGGTLTVI